MKVVVGSADARFIPEEMGYVLEDERMNTNAAIRKPVLMLWKNLSPKREDDQQPSRKKVEGS